MASEKLTYSPHNPVEVLELMLSVWRYGK